MCASKDFRILDNGRLYPLKASKVSDNEASMEPDLFIRAT